MKITIDPGHGPLDNRYVLKESFYEGTQMWYIAQHLKRELESRGIEVVCTRPSIKDFLSVDARGAIAAKNKSNMLLSLHSNACDNSEVRGTEVYYSVRGPEYKTLAKNLADTVSKIMGHNSRGAKTRESDRYGKTDYYGVIRSAANNGCTCAMILEHGFHSNKEDATFLSQDKNLKRLAEAEAEVIAAYFNIKPKPQPAPPQPAPPQPVPPQPAPPQPAPPQHKTPILSAPTASVAQAVSWASGKGATETFISLASMYWELGVNAGVNPAIAYCQSAKETAYGNFGGAVLAEFCNPCGMKEGGNDAEAGFQKFAGWKEGVSAHIDHLALYAGAAGYPKSETCDPRHFPWLKGMVSAVEELGGHWATSVTYGNEIAEMLEVLEKAEPKEKPEGIELTLKNAISDGVITDENYWRGVLTGSRSANPEYIKAVMDRYHNMAKGMSND